MEQQLEYKPDYKLERWIALILTLFFLLPFIALAQEPEPEHAHIEWDSVTATQWKLRHQRAPRHPVRPCHPQGSSG